MRSKHLLYCLGVAVTAVDVAYTQSPASTRADRKKLNVVYFLVDNLGRIDSPSITPTVLH
jgi:hypothetical protein